MTDIIVGIIGVMLIVYLFIMVQGRNGRGTGYLRRIQVLLLNGFMAAGTRTMPSRGFKALGAERPNVPGRYKGPREKADAPRSQSGRSAETSLHNEIVSPPFPCE